MTTADWRLIHATANGELADFSATDTAANDSAHGRSWDDQRTLSAEVIRTLATGSNFSWNILPTGLRIAGARITGVLDLSDAAMRFPIAFVKCYFECELSLRNASVKSVF